MSLRIAAAALLATTVLAFSSAGADTRKPSDFETFSNYLSARQAASDFNLTEAYKYYKLSLADDPSNTDLLSRTFVYAASSGDIEGGAKLAKQVVAATPDNKLAQLVLIVDAIKRGHYGDVATYTKRADGSVSAGPTVLLLSAWASVGQRDYDGALAQLDILKKAGNADVFADYHRALILDLAGRDADAAYKQALVDVGPAPRIVDAYGRYLERMGRTDDAKTFYTKLSDQSALDPITSAGLARIASGKKPDALVTDAKLGAGEAMFGVGASLTDNSTADLAILYLRCALYLRPDLDLAKVLLADRFETLKKYDDALAIYQTIGKSSPYYRVAAIQAAINMARLKRNDDAVAALKPLVAADPTDQDAATALGDVYRAMEKYNEAADAYTLAIKTIPTPAQKDWPLFYARAVAEQQADRWSDAEADLQTALKLSPDEPDVLNNLGYSWVEKQKNIPQALVMLEKARSLRPFDGYIVDSVGWAYYRLGKYDDAAKTLLNAVLLVPGDPTINEHLGDAYWRVGKKLDAQFQWSHAIAFGADDKTKPELEEKLKSGLPAVTASN